VTHMNYQLLDLRTTSPQDMKFRLPPHWNPFSIERGKLNHGQVLNQLRIQGCRSVLYIFKGFQVKRIDFVDLGFGDANVPEKLVEYGLC
jgi:hypothetical protein